MKDLKGLPLYYIVLSNCLGQRYKISFSFKIKSLYYLAKIIPKKLLWYALSRKKYIVIPKPVLQLYSKYRSTPLKRAFSLENYLGLTRKVKIYYKDESRSPVLNYKLNAALPAIYFGKKEGFSTVVCETLNGAWGVAVAFAALTFGLKCKIIMSKYLLERCKISIDLMKEFKAEIEVVGVDSYHELNSFAMNIAIKYRYLYPGIFLDAFQSIIGSEINDQLRSLNVKASTFIAPIGSGTNFAGLISPFVLPFIRGEIKTKFIGVESSGCPVLSEGRYGYVVSKIGDSYFSSKRYYLDVDFNKSNTKAAGLMVTSASPLLSLLYKNNIISVATLNDEKARKAGDIFYNCEKIMPVFESSYAVAGAIDCAINAKIKNMEETIIFSLTGSNTIRK